MSRTRRRGSLLLGALRLEVCEVWGPPAAAGIPDLAVQIYARDGTTTLYTLTLTPGQARALATLLTQRPTAPEESP